MNLYIYRKLTVSEKRKILYTIIFFFVSGLIILFEMPDGREVCLRSPATGQNELVAISVQCFDILVKSIMIMDKLFFVVRSVLVSIVCYFGLFLVLKFWSWVNSA